jgi:pimeloyl-ACP methyl ester carboxylesterase
MFAGFTSQRLNATTTQLAARLAPLGVRSIACDLSGHGDSTGNIAEQTIHKAADEIEALIDYVCGKHRAYPRPLGLVGNSFSANAAIVATARSSAVSALALKSPVTDYVLMRTALLGESGMNRWKRDGYVELPGGTRSNYTFIEDAAKINTYKELASLKIPVLAMQGSADAEIPQESRRMLESLMSRPGMTYVLVEGGDHRLADPHFERTIRTMADFLTQSLGLNR